MKISEAVDASTCGIHGNLTSNKNWFRYVVLGMQMPKAAWPLGDEVFQNGEQLVVKYEANHVHSSFHLHNFCGHRKCNLFLIHAKSTMSIYVKLLPRWCSWKRICCQCRGCKRHQFNPWVGKIPWIWRRKWQPTQLFLPGKFHGVGSLMDYSPWGHKESDTTENAHTTYVQSVIGFQTHKQPFHLFEWLMRHSKVM